MWQGNGVGGEWKCAADVAGGDFRLRFKGGMRGEVPAVFWVAAEEEMGRWTWRRCSMCFKYGGLDM